MNLYKQVYETLRVFLHIERLKFNLNNCNVMMLFPRGKENFRFSGQVKPSQSHDFKLPEMDLIRVVS